MRHWVHGKFISWLGNTDHTRETIDLSRGKGKFCENMVDVWGNIDNIVKGLY
jgi:hypothetical protein